MSRTLHPGCSVLDMSWQNRRGDIAILAASQWGLVTATQARNLGVTTPELSRASAAGDLVRVRRGIYRIAGAPIHPDEELRAAWLSLGRDAIVSHRSAARLHNLGTVDADTHSFITAHPARTTHSDIHLRPRTLPAHDITRVDGLPVTTPSRTIGDLASDHTDGHHLADVITDALRRGMSTPEQISAHLTPHARRYGLRGRSGSDLLEYLINE